MGMTMKASWRVMRVRGAAATRVEATGSRGLIMCRLHKRHWWPGEA